MGPFDDWIGRTRNRRAAITQADMARLAAVFDWPEGPSLVPPGWHWAALTETMRQSDIGTDGHPARGGFLPPIPSPLRMFAASRMAFDHPLLCDAPTELVETITGVHEKSGRTGPLTFLTVERRLRQRDRLCVKEVQSIVYRHRTPYAPSKPSPASITPHWRIRITPDPVLLFRFSAATFNSHRIHYDRDYATRVEMYPALVVHGPLIALSLLEGLRKSIPGSQVKQFEFKALRPLFDNAPFEVCGVVDGDAVTLWAEAPDGGVAMSASARLAGPNPIAAVKDA